MTTTESTNATPAVRPIADITIDRENAADDVWMPRLNHPKNYVGAVIAAAADGDTKALVEQHVVGMGAEAVKGARALGFLDEEGNVTPAGQIIVDFALDEAGDMDAALQQFEDWKGTRGQFAEKAPGWAAAMGDAIRTYPPAAVILDLLADLDGEATLVELAAAAHESNPEFAAAMFYRSGVDPEEADLEAAETYRSGTTFQFKMLMYHAGLLTETGSDSASLDPADDVWAIPDDSDEE